MYKNEYIEGILYHSIIQMSIEQIIVNGNALAIYNINNISCNNNNLYIITYYIKIVIIARKLI